MKMRNSATWRPLTAQVGFLPDGLFAILRSGRVISGSRFALPQGSGGSSYHAVRGKPTGWPSACGGVPAWAMRKRGYWVWRRRQLESGDLSPALTARRSGVGDGDVASRCAPVARPDKHLGTCIGSYRQQAIESDTEVTIA